MPIHDFSYRHWQGQRSNRPPSWILGWAQLRVVSRHRAVRFLLLLSGLVVLVFLVLLYIEIMPHVGILGFLNQFHLPPLDGRMLLRFFTAQRWIHYLLCLAAGAEVIALDRRYKALQIYLARPLGVGQYLLGKGLPLLILFSVSSWIPALFLLFLKSIATASLQWLRDEPFLPLAILGYGIVDAVTLTALTLTISSLSSSARLAGGQLVALLLLSWVFANLLSKMTGNDVWWLFFIGANLGQLCHWVLQTTLPLETSPWLSLVLMLALILGCGILLHRRVRAVEVVGGS